MTEPAREISLNLPTWTEQFTQRAQVYPTVADKMGFVLDLLEAQILNDTGYPFSAVIFDSEHRVAGVGVNNSLLLKNSTAHAEMLALQFAQSEIGKAYLPKNGGFTLVTSAQPCSMCVGAIYASGIRELVVAASQSDVTEILGFGPGPLHPQWREFFAAKGITIVEDVEKNRARSLMLKYADAVSRLRDPKKYGGNPETGPSAMTVN